MNITAENKAARKILSVPSRQTQPWLLWLPPSSLLQSWESWTSFPLRACRKSNTQRLHHGKQDNLSLSSKSSNPALAQLSRVFVFATSRSCLRSSFRLMDSVAVASPQQNTSFRKQGVSTHHHGSVTIAVMQMDIITWSLVLEGEEATLPSPFLRVVGVPCAKLFFAVLDEERDSDLQAKEGTDYIFMIPVSDFINNHNFL